MAGKQKSLLGNETGQTDTVKSVKMKKLPGVLSFQRCLVVTDGLFYNESENSELTPVTVIRHGIRGTQNINKGSKEGQGTSSSTKREEVSNIQTTDSAKLSATAKCLQVRFQLRAIDIRDALFACAPGKDDDMQQLKAFRQALTDFIAKATDQDTVTRLAERYVRNIANGRFLWRNRMAAKAILIDVSNRDGSLKKSFNALDVPLHDFDEITEDEKILAGYLARGFKGDLADALQVIAHVDFGVGGAVEVFPSQNYIENKAQGFARPLYCVGDAPEKQDQHGVQIMGQAALRDQKIGNALRTIDTWYPAFENYGRPLAVEPNGASLEAQEFFRGGTSSGFDMLRRVAEIDPESDDGLFLLACIIRGGVFSGSD